MKLKIFLMSAFMLIFLSLSVSIGTSSENPPLPVFNVHVQPVVCDGSNVAHATVTVTDISGTPQTSNTDANGWAYFTCAVGTVHVVVTLSWDQCTGFDGYRTQPTGGNPNVQVCLVSWCGP